MFSLITPSFICGKTKATLLLFSQDFCIKIYIDHKSQNKVSLVKVKVTQTNTTSVKLTKCVYCGKCIELFD